MWSALISKSFFKTVRLYGVQPVETRLSSIRYVGFGEWSLTAMSLGCVKTRNLRVFQGSLCLSRSVDRRLQPVLSGRLSTRAPTSRVFFIQPRSEAVSDSALGRTTAPEHRAREHLEKIVDAYSTFTFQRLSEPVSDVRNYFWNVFYRPYRKRNQPHVALIDIWIVSSST